MVKPIFIAVTLIFSATLEAGCPRPAFLKGVLELEHCEKTDDCMVGTEALAAYAQHPDNPRDPRALNILLQTSPWRAYDSELRILTVAELAESARPHVASGVTRVVLIGSWTGRAVEPAVASLAERLSAALGGFQVDGQDGFLWFAPDGSTRTTQQAFTVHKGGIYRVPAGADVMAAMAVGWPVLYSDRPEMRGNAKVMLSVAVGWDILMLCPDSALSSFETAARLGSTIAAYNAALIRLERNAAGDREAAEALLVQAVDAGDVKAKTILMTLRRNEQ